jgi:conjugative transfer region protein TrbK
MRWRPVLLFVLAGVALAIATTEKVLLSPPTLVVEAGLAGPLTETLRRCRDLGRAALADEDCRAEWRSFLSPAPQPTRGMP